MNHQTTAISRIRSISLDPELLGSAVDRLRARYADIGETVEHEVLEAAVEGWLNDSVESLLEDAPFHAIEGDGSYAFNRRGFTSALSRFSRNKSV